MDYKEQFGLSISHVPDEEYLASKNSTKRIQGGITGVHSYDMLLNPIYAEKFQYVSMYLPHGYDRNKINMDGDDDNLNN